MINHFGPNFSFGTAKPEGFSWETAGLLLCVLFSLTPNVFYRVKLPEATESGCIAAASLFLYCTNSSTNSANSSRNVSTVDWVSCLKSSDFSNWSLNKSNLLDAKAKYLTLGDFWAFYYPLLSV